MLPTLVVHQGALVVREARKRGALSKKQIACPQSLRAIRFVEDTLAADNRVSGSHKLTEKFVIILHPTNLYTPKNDNNYQLEFMCIYKYDIIIHIKNVRHSEWHQYSQIAFLTSRMLRNLFLWLLVSIICLSLASKVLTNAVQPAM